MAWTNADGLVVKFAKEGGRSARGGALNTEGAAQITEIDLQATTLTTTQVVYGTDAAGSAHGIVLPRGARIEKIEILVSTAFAGAATALNIGLINLDRTTGAATTAVCNGVLIGTLTAGANLTAVTTTTPGGTAMGTVLANGGVITVASVGGTFSAGRAKVRVHYSAGN